MEQSPSGTSDSSSQPFDLDGLIYADALYHRCSKAPMLTPPEDRRYGLVSLRATGAAFMVRDGSLDLVCFPGTLNHRFPIVFIDVPEVDSPQALVDFSRQVLGLVASRSDPRSTHGVAHGF